MFINFSLILERMSMNEFLILQSIKQKDLYHKIYEEDFITKLIDEGFLEMQKNGEPKLTKIGNNFLHMVTDAPASPEVTKLSDELCAMYKARNKSIGKKMEVSSRLAWFINASQFKDSLIKEAVAEYLASSGEYTSSLENLIWKPQSIMSVHKNLKDSKLFDLILSKHNVINVDFYFDEKYQTNALKYAMAISKLPKPVNNANPDMTLTGSRSGDMNLIEKVRKALFEYIRKREEDGKD